MREPKKNPLLDIKGLPAFAQIKPDHIQPAINYLLAKNRNRIAARLQGTTPYTWDNTLKVFEDLE
ncbi:MAG: hypothetical protein ACE1Z4_01755, partial [Gammaproteobacteria bacterium]